MIEVEKKELRDLGFGIEEDGKLLLHEVEYAYALEKGYIEGDKERVEEVIRGREKLYRLYAYLREKGYIPRITQKEEVIRVGRKGFRKGEDRTLYLIVIVDGIKKEELMELLRKAERARKELILAFVDERVELVAVKRKLFN